MIYAACVQQGKSLGKSSTDVQLLTMYLMEGSTIYTPIIPSVLTPPIVLLILTRDSGLVHLDNLTGCHIESHTENLLMSTLSSSWCNMYLVIPTTLVYVIILFVLPSLLRIHSSIVFKFMLVQYSDIHNNKNIL